MHMPKELYHIGAKDYGIEIFCDNLLIKDDVLFAVLSNDDNQIPGHINGLQDAFHIVAGGKASGIHKHTSLTKAALGKLAFRQFSLLSTTLAPIADKHIVCILLCHIRTPAGNPVPSAGRNYPCQNDT